jgi:hypothetical protein
LINGHFQSINGLSQDLNPQRFCAGNTYQLISASNMPAVERAYGQDNPTKLAANRVLDMMFSTYI